MEKMLNKTWWRMAGVLLVLGGCWLSPGRAADDATPARPTLPLIMDCDPGSDDAMALWLLHALGRSPDFLVATPGNSPRRQVFANLELLARHLGLKAPLWMGAEKRADGTEPQTDGFFLFDGLTGVSGELMARHGNPGPIRAGGVQATVDFIRAHEKVEYFAAGPLTTLAAALRAAPDISSHLEKVCVMGGSIDNPEAQKTDFNTICDIQAAAAVYSSGVPLIVFPIHETIKEVFTDSFILSLEETGKLPVLSNLIRGAFTANVREDNELYAELHDMVVAAYFIAPESFQITEKRLRIGDKAMLVSDPDGIPIRVMTQKEPLLLRRLFTEIYRRAGADLPPTGK